MAFAKQLVALVLALAVLNPLCCCLGESEGTPPAQKSCCTQAVKTGHEAPSPGDLPPSPCQCSSNSKMLVSGGEAPLVPALVGIEIPSLPPIAVAGTLDLPSLGSTLWKTRARAAENAPPRGLREHRAVFCVFLI